MRNHLQLQKPGPDLIRPAVVVLTLAALLVSGCTWTIVPPKPEGDSVAVFVTAYDKHTRIALPDGRDRFIEYGFGDWKYYALEEWGALSALRAAFFSADSAFSRRELPWTEDEETFRRAAGGVRSLRIEVEPEPVLALLAKLEARWQELDEERVYREWEDLTLAKWDRRYHLFFSSNHQTADWLRQTGAEVRGWALLNEFELAPSPPSARDPRSPDP